MVPTVKDAYDLFARGTAALARLERNGVRVHEERLDQSIADVKARIASSLEALKADPAWSLWRRRHGRRANIDSRVQLADVVFGGLGLVPAGRTATGRDRTDEQSFEGIDLPFVRDYFARQKLVKARGVLEGIRAETVGGFLHPFYSLTTGEDSDKGGAVTYRGSSSGPNFQNMPLRNKGIGKIIRECIIPREGWCLVEADFGQLEGNIAACFWRDPGMVSYFSDPAKDIHRDFAAHCFLCEPSQVSKEMRTVGKNGFVFPVLYGSDWVNCSEHMWKDVTKYKACLKDGTPVHDHLRSKGVTELGPRDRRQGPQRGCYEHVVKQAQDRFNDAFPTWSRRKEEWWREYQARGWFDLMTGFRVHGEYSRNFLMNCPIQGPGFHCLLWSLVRTQNWLDRKAMRSLAVGQIHDCLLLDVPPDELQAVLRKVKRVMTRELEASWDWIIVPMKAEIDVVEPGSTWYDKRPFSDETGVWAPKAA